MSGFNRRQIVWQLWQNERADKFIREKAPVGVFVGHHQPSLSGPSTPALPPDLFIHAWHRAFLYQPAAASIPGLPGTHSPMVTEAPSPTARVSVD